MKATGSKEISKLFFPYLLSCTLVLGAFLFVQIMALDSFFYFIFLFCTVMLFSWFSQLKIALFTITLTIFCALFAPTFLGSHYFFKLFFFTLASGTLALMISKEKHRLKASLKNREDLKYALDSSAIVAITDAHGKITSVNDKFCEISQYSREELIGQDHRIVNSHFHSKEFFNDLWSTIKSGKVWNGEIRNRAKDGSFYWVSTSIVPFLDERGRPYQYIAIRNDITLRKKVEEDLKVAVKARDEFLSVASHELKTPLTSLMLQAQLFKRGIENNDEKFMQKERMARFVDHAERQSVRLTRLVDDMLDIGRINSGKLTMHKEVISLNELFQDVIDRLGPVMRETQTPVDFICHELIESECDRFRMEQVLINLLTNTIKYGEKRPVQVVLEKENDRAHLKVIDQGLGVPDEVKEKIFNRFERAVSYHEVAGLGLGLYITREIVEAHGGSIWVESDGEKKGSTFHVNIPLGQEMFH